MNINLVLTGGTIGSSLNDEDALETYTEMMQSVLINDVFEKRSHYKDLVSFSVSNPIDTLSENMTFEKLNSLIDHIRGMDLNDTDAVIVTHGTDTLAYTANLLSLLLMGVDIPVFIISSGKPLSKKEANGYDNFTKAVEMILEGTPSGVYVPYLNKSGELIVHNGNRLVQSSDLSPDFESCHHKLNDISSVITELYKNLPKETKVDSTIPLLYQTKKLNGNILTIMPQTGIDYINYDLRTVDAVLHRGYHSSTVPVDTEGSASIIYLLEKCKKRGIPMYLSPILSNSTQTYSSTAQIIKRGVIPLFDMSFEMSYIYLVLKNSLS